MVRMIEERKHQQQYPTPSTSSMPHSRNHQHHHYDDPSSTGIAVNSKYEYCGEDVEVVEEGLVVNVSVENNKNNKGSRDEDEEEYYERFNDNGGDGDGCYDEDVEYYDNDGYDEDGTGEEGQGDGGHGALSSSLPTEYELVLLCLDYLRGIRRSFPSVTLYETEGIDPNYITMACWALNKAIQPPASGGEGNTTGAINDYPNDPWFDATKAINNDGKKKDNDDHNNNYSSTALVDAKKMYAFPPDLTSMEKEILMHENELSKASNPAIDRNNSNDGSSLYEYDDTHSSNIYRFYPLAGLASGPCIRGPLGLNEIVAAGLCGLGARSRKEAEHDMTRSLLFQQFVRAVREKGFFDHQPYDENTENDIESTAASNTRRREHGSVAVDDNGNAGDEENQPETARVLNDDASLKKTSSTTGNSSNNINTKKQLLYEERYRKVVAKFRTKLATKADAMTTGDLIAFSAADQQRKQREYRIQLAYNNLLLPQQKKEIQHPSVVSTLAGRTAMMSQLATPTSISTKLSSHFSHIHNSKATSNTPTRTLLQEKNNVSNYPPTMSNSSSVSHPLHQYNQVDIDEAEKYKGYGNACMSRKEYGKAADYYTQALKLTPAGPNSHIYYSHRAAALVSMKRFEDAVIDSKRSIALKPDNGKAHSRLGLAHFLLGNYQEAIDSYTIALKYEPDNKSNMNYLAKSMKRLKMPSSAPTGDEDDTGTPNIMKVGDTNSVTGKSNKQNGCDSGDGQGTKVPSSTRSTTSISTNHNNQPQQLHRHQVEGKNNNGIGGEREAEKYKLKGNALMASRDYLRALDAYTTAIELCPFGSQSHVYYSNRAAALCYLERYTEAEEDSITSLQLNPTYGKAHARLGLSRFFLQDYVGAVDAYTKALEHDPNNAASKSYLAKALSRLEGTGTTSSHAVSNATTAVLAQSTTSTVRI